MQLIGLPDTRKIRHCERFRTPAGAIALLRRKIVGTTADSNGALNVYVDKFGKYRCIAMRYCCEIDSQTFTSLVAARKWVIEWLEKIK